MCSRSILRSWHPANAPTASCPLFLVREMPVGLAGLLLASIVPWPCPMPALVEFSGRVERARFCKTARAKAPTPPASCASPRHDARVGLVLMGFGLVKWGPLLETGLTVASLPFAACSASFFSARSTRRQCRGALAGMIVGLATILCLFQFTSVAYTWYFMIARSSPL